MLTREKQDKPRLYGQESEGRGLGFASRANHDFSTLFFWTVLRRLLTQPRDGSNIVLSQELLTLSCISCYMRQMCPDRFRISNRYAKEIVKEKAVLTSLTTCVKSLKCLAWGEVGHHEWHTRAPTNLTTYCFLQPPLRNPTRKIVPKPVNNTSLWAPSDG